MKKLFSMLLAVAMLLSISIVPAYAAATTSEIIVAFDTALTAGVATKMTLTINLDDDTDKIMAPFIIFNSSDFDSIELVDASDFGEDERAFSLQDYGYELQAYNGNGYPDGTSFTFDVVPNTEDATLEFDVESSMITTVGSDVFLDTITIVIPEDEDPTPSIATVVPTEAVLTDVAEAMIEKGQAVAMTFNAGDIKGYADMSWKVDFQSGTKYAPVNFPAETLADVEDNSPVQFVAAFLVYDRGYADVDVINSVSAGFSDANKNLVAQTAAVTVE